MKSINDSRSIPMCVVSLYLSRYLMEPRKRVNKWESSRTRQQYRCFEETVRLCDDNDIMKNPNDGNIITKQLEWRVFSIKY